MKNKVLFICTHNSARSQIAEALVNLFHSDKYEAFSAGTHPTEINPYVVKVMNEMDIDLSTARAKSIDEFRGMEFDLVVTVCDGAKGVCPFFPGAKKMMHKNFLDPSGFSGSEEDIIENVRHLRDEIKEWLRDTFGD